MAWLVFVTIVLSLATSIVLVPLVRSLAIRFNIVDQPDSERKLHRKPIALGGGVAVFGAVVATFTAVVLMDRTWGESLIGYNNFKWYVLFGAAAAMLLVGLIDDVIALRGRQKLLFQCLIIAGVVGSGTIVNTIGIFGWELNLGILSFPFTVLWLIVAVNALNLIDGADGMATTAGCIVSAGLAILGWQTGEFLSTAIGFALAGALLGFLVFNRPPASIFLGDAGSMMIGLFVGVLAVWSSVKESTALASAPVAILAIPLVDSSAAIVRRWLTGRSLYTTDRGHLHHLLQEKFGSRGMLIVVAVLCLFTTLLASIATWLNTPWLSAVGVVGVLAALVVTRSFGYAECRLVASKAAGFTQSFFTKSSKCESDKVDTRVPLQGTGDWETVWEPLVEFAKTHDLAKININLNLAWLHEGYHASWKSVRLPEKAFQMVVRLPLFSRRLSGEQVSIGILEIVAPANDPSVYERIADLSAKLVDLGPQIDIVTAELERQHIAKNSTAAKPSGVPSEPDSPEAPVTAKL